jgi:hypothetical protein
MLCPAIKTGRYTHEKKASNIMEVKQLEEQCRRFLLSPSELENMEQEDCIPDSVDTVDLPEQQPMTPCDIGGTALTPCELDAIIHHITEVHLKQTPLTPEFCETINYKVKVYLVSLIICILCNKIKIRKSSSLISLF